MRMSKQTQPRNNKLPIPEIYHFSEISRILLACRDRIRFLSSKSSLEVEKRLNSIIEYKEIKILSFDVFDTFLLRNSTPEALRYLELSSILAKILKQSFPDAIPLRGMSAEDLMLTRIMGMQATYRTRPLVDNCGEGHIDEVIAMQTAMAGLKDGASEIFLDAEIDYEAENLTPNPVLTRLAKSFRERGGKVILMSDMYLGADAIGRIIHKLIDEPVHDHLFSSADLVISKRCGKMFDMMEEKFQLDGAQFLHIGDSWAGDVASPRKKGWNAVYFPVSEQELRQRRKRLNSFIAWMDKKGIDVRDWAKI